MPTDLTATASCISQVEYPCRAASDKSNTSGMKGSVGASTEGDADRVVMCSTRNDKSLGFRTSGADTVRPEMNIWIPPSSSVVGPSHSSCAEQAIEAGTGSLCVATAADVQEDSVRKEVMHLGDKTTTDDACPLLGLSSLRPSFASLTCRERIDAGHNVCCALGTSMLRDDPSLPPRGDSISSSVETEVLRPRVSPHSMSSLDGESITPQCKGLFSSATPDRLQATGLSRVLGGGLPSDGALSPRASAASPNGAGASTDDVCTQGQAEPSRGDVCVSCPMPVHVPSPALPVAPTRPSAVGETLSDTLVEAFPVAFRCPQVVGEESLCRGSFDPAVDLRERLNVPAVRTCVPGPTPPLIIDIISGESTPEYARAKRIGNWNGVAFTSKKSLACSALVPLLPGATAAGTTEIPQRLGVNPAACSLGGELSAQLIATGHVASVVGSSRPLHDHQHPQWDFLKVRAAAPPSVSKHLTSQILTDVVVGLTQATPNVPSASSRGSKGSGAGAWSRGTAAAPPMPVDTSSTTPLCKEGSRLPPRPPKPLGDETPQAPYAVDGSLMSTVWGAADYSLCSKLSPPHPLVPSLLSESKIDSDARGSLVIRPYSALTPLPAGASRKWYRRHDPYSLKGFALCEGSSFTFALSPTNRATARPSHMLTALRQLPIGRAAAGATKMTKRFFLDPLIKASALLHEHRRLLRADAARSSSPEKSSSSRLCADPVPAEGGDEEDEDGECASQLLSDEMVDSSFGEPASAPTFTLPRPVDGELIVRAPAAAPRSYAEALRRSRSLSHGTVVNLGVKFAGKQET